MLKEESNDLGKSGCVAILAGICMLGFCGHAFYWDARYRMDGATAIGKVTYAWTQATKRGREDYGYYEFRVNDRTFSGKARSLAVGSSVNVEYLRSDPRTSRLTHQRSTPSPWLLGGGLALLAYGLVRWIRFDSLGG